MSPVRIQLWLIQSPSLLHYQTSSIQPSFQPLFVLHSNARNTQSPTSSFAQRSITLPLCNSGFAQLKSKKRLLAGVHSIISMFHFDYQSCIHVDVVSPNKIPTSTGKLDNVRQGWKIRMRSGYGDGANTLTVFCGFSYKPVYLIKWRVGELSVLINILMLTMCTMYTQISVYP